jgi:23S rRNA (adenine2503-C2)-methyltransferase
MKTPIQNLTADELRQWLANLSCPSYRADQICAWLYQKWVSDFEQMRNLPAELRRTLAEHFAPTAVQCQQVDDDGEGTEKFLLRLADGEFIESVLIRTPARTTLCVSTQVGCPVRCAFCASGRHGLVRNLDAAEIIDQVVHACRHLGKLMTNIVVMGMGEPLLNFTNTVTALDMLCADAGLGLGARRVTISTSGIPDKIRALADLGRQWGLALSLHAVTDTKRAKIIPARYRSPLDTILDACVYYFEKTGRVVTLEYALMQDFNDSPADCAGLAAITRRLRAKVNLIPCNAAGSSYRMPAPSDVENFAARLQRQGVNVTVRHSKGDSIQAACGQLRQRRLQEQRKVRG